MSHIGALILAAAIFLGVILCMHRRDDPPPPVPHPINRGIGLSSGYTAPVVPVTLTVSSVPVLP
jgi:hypothetical protein